LNTPVSRALLACLLLTTAATEAQVYRCEQDGKLAFSDQPCKPGAKVTQKAYAQGSNGAIDLQIAVNHYTVQGRDYASLGQSLAANGPKGYHGLATWTIGYEFTTKKLRDGCQMDTVKVKVGGTILMPKWADEQAASPDLQQRWRAYYAALKLHEDGHIQHGREMAMLVKERLLGLGLVPCDRTQALAAAEFNTIVANLKTRDAEYDARTNHGASQGARL
jgi:predicted secreted Zn-dependent protease